MRRRILIVEDDDDTAKYVAAGLRQSGFDVERAENGRHGLYLATDPRFDAVIVDRMVDHICGLDLVSALRATQVNTPVLILSAISSAEERVAGLDAGSDDYLEKPFAFSELLARMNALMRRSKPREAETVTVLEFAGLELDLITRTARRDGAEVYLSSKEFSIVEFLLRNKESVVTRTMLLEKIWGLRFNPGTNIVDVHMSKVRQKIDRDFTSPLLHTVKGVGYCLSGEP